MSLVLFLTQLFLNRGVEMDEVIVSTPRERRNSWQPSIPWDGDATLKGREIKFRFILSNLTP